MRRTILLLSVFVLAACQGVVPAASPTGAPPATEGPAATDGPAATGGPSEAPSATDTPAAPTPLGVTGARDAIVRIVAEGTFYEPLAGQTETAGQGTGFIIDPSGIVVTNNHVVTGGSIFRVYFDDSTTESTRAQLLGQSECADLAVLQLLDEQEYPTLSWFEDEVEVGQRVQAAGYPEETYSLREGQVQTSPQALSTQWAAVDDVIEHTSGILGGFSGGPLLTDPDGEVLGVNYARESEDERSYAIAASQAQDIVEQLAEGQDVNAIGINGQAVVSEDGTLSGIWVASVKAGSPADRAQIIPGDLIVELGDLRVGQDGTMQRYCDVLIGNPAGQPLRVTWANIEEGLCYSAQLNTSDRRGQPVRCPDDIVLETEDGGTGDGMNMSLIHESIRDTCTEATPWPGAIASVSCTPSEGADSLYFDAFPDIASMNEYLDSQIEAHDLTTGGTCEEGPNEGTWSLNEVQRGRLICFDNLGVWYQYSYDDHNVLITAIRSDGDYAAMWEWWTTADDSILVE